jgi:protein-L-isoaspartate(D-aspartate) O-methyltransferase
VTAGGQDDPARLGMLAAVDERVGPARPAVRRALLAVDRARFVRPIDRARAFVDEPLPLDTPYGEGVATVSAPHVYVLGFQAVGLEEGDRLLELGSGSGYGAALASEVVGARGRVTTVEVDPHLASLAASNVAERSNVSVVHDDGLVRADLLAAHQKCWLTFSVDEVPHALLAALPRGGMLVAPVGVPGRPHLDQRFLRYRREGDGRMVVDDLGAVRFVRARTRIV